MLALALCASCAVVVGLEDKQPYPSEPAETGAPDVTEPDGNVPVPPPDGGAGGEIVAEDQKAPYGIVVDEAFVYWTNETDGTVMRRVKTLAAPAEKFVVEQPQPQHMLLDNSYVYWSNNNSPKKALSDGGREIPILLRASRGGAAPQVPNVISRVNDLDRMTKRISLWNGTIPNDGGVDMVVFLAQKDETRRFARTGGGFAEVSQAPGPNHDYAAVTTDELHAYYFDQTGNTLFRRHKLFDKQVPIAQEEPVATTPASVLIVDIGVDATNVYLVSQGGQVYVVPKVPDGGAASATTLGAPVGAVVKSMLVTDTALFVTHWTAGADGEIVRMAKDGTSKVLASGLSEPNEMFLDIENAKETIYWTNRADGTVRRLVVE